MDLHVITPELSDIIPAQLGIHLYSERVSTTASHLREVRMREQMPDLSDIIPAQVGSQLYSEPHARTTSHPREGGDLFPSFIRSAISQLVNTRKFDSLCPVVTLKN